MVVGVEGAASPAPLEGVECVFAETGVFAVHAVSASNAAAEAQSVDLIRRLPVVGEVGTLHVI
jgi:hypothetical protein